MFASFLDAVTHPKTRQVHSTSTRWAR
jgi:hypothetical protein